MALEVPGATHGTPRGPRGDRVLGPQGSGGSWGSHDRGLYHPLELLAGGDGIEAGDEVTGRTCHRKLLMETERHIDREIRQTE